jgi:lipoprotein-anchoring transpeptidase ErfK/SrfK
MIGEGVWVKPRWLSPVPHAITGCALLLASAVSLSSPLNAREVIALKGEHIIGTAIINTLERRLYSVLGYGAALRHSVGVGKKRMTWSGETVMRSNRLNLGWMPLLPLRRETSDLPAFVRPGPENSSGISAINLGRSEYRSHGAGVPASIGRAASSGCITMLNADVVDLLERAPVGAPVHV